MKIGDFDHGQIAMIAHEANRAYCHSIGDDSQPAWVDAPEWQWSSALAGVRFHIDALASGHEPAPSASHDSWLAQKRDEGWKYGPVKNPAMKEHPCFVEYHELPLEQRLKDYIFSGIVRSFYEAALTERVAA